MGEEDKTKSIVQVGEILVASNEDTIEKCTNNVQKILENKKIMKYLKQDQKVNRLNDYLG